MTHGTHLQADAAAPSSQAHDATPSAMLKRVDHLPGFMVLASDACSQQDGFPQLVPLQKEGAEPSETVCPTGQARGNKLVTEDSKPVGSGRFRVPSQDSSWVLGPTWSSSFPLRQGPHLGSSSQSKDLTALKGQTAPPLYQDTTLSASQNRGGLSANSTRVR